jgi:molybdopterin-guanine dinucleotide biosynthesis protein A
VETTGVVLAGGRSRRFGSGNKALARVDGVTLVERVVETVATTTTDPPIVAVARPDQRDALRDVLAEYDPDFVFDADSFAGPIAGVAAATRAASTPWLFACACDMPFLSTSVLAWLGSHRPTDADAIVPVVGGTRQPLHAFYRRSSVENVLPAVPATSSLQRLLDELADSRHVSVSSSPADVDVERSARNVNTKPELTAIRNRF